MTILSRMVKNIKQGDSLIITPRIDQHLLTHPEGITWDEEAFGVLASITGQDRANSDRTARFGASGRGSCHRRQIFGFLGMPVHQVLSPVTVNLFADGKFRHIKWQIMGMQAGVFTHVEYPAVLKQYNLKVSMDALNADEAWFFELKGDRNIGRLLGGGIPDAHNLQIHTCMLVTGWDTAVYVMEDKSTQEWREFVVKKNPIIMRAVKEELLLLNECVEYQRLPRVLPACQKKEGPYRTCPYGERCLRQQDWHGDQWPEPGEWPDD